MQIPSLITATLITLHSTYAAAFDFKGLTPNEEPSPPLGAPSWNCKPFPQIPGKSFCSKTNETIAGVSAIATLVSLRNGKVKLVSVTFSEKGFAQVEAALIEKFGKPSNEHVHELQNRMGATFQSKRLIWLDGDQTMTLTQRSKRIDESSFSVSSQSALARIEEDSKSRAQSNKSDL